MSGVKIGILCLIVWMSGCASNKGTVKLLESDSEFLCYIIQEYVPGVSEIPEEFPCSTTALYQLYTISYLEGEISNILEREGTITMSINDEEYVFTLYRADDSLVIDRIEVMKSEID